MSIKSDNVPPFWQQATISCAFSGSMVLSSFYGNESGAIIASDGLGLSLKNMLRSEKDVQVRVALLAAGVLGGLIVDAFTEGAFGLSSMGIASGIKILDREFNLFLSGKGYDAEGNKVKKVRSFPFLVAVVCSIAAIAFSINKWKGNAVLTDATLCAFSTAFKNLTKKMTHFQKAALLSLIVVAAAIGDKCSTGSFFLASGSENSALGLSLGLICKEGIRGLENLQMGDLEEDEIKGKKELESTGFSSEPLPMVQQLFLLGSSLALTIKAGGCKKINPVFKGSLIKMSSKIFHNIMRQLPFQRSLPIVCGASGGLFVFGGILSTLKNPQSVGETMMNIGQSLPFQELKAWQLGKKVSQENKDKKIFTV